MVDWSVRQLDVQYVPGLRLAVGVLPPASNDRSPLPLSQVFVDGGVIVGGNEFPESLTTVFPARHRQLVLVAPGGAGKSTLVSYLCHQAAVARAEGKDSQVPLLLLLRDLGQEDTSEGPRRGCRHRCPVANIGRAHHLPRSVSAGADPHRDQALSHARH